MSRAAAAVLLIAMLALLAGASTYAEAGPGAPFLVGIASRSVGPTSPICLGGHAVFCARPHKGIKDDPLAQATAFTDAVIGTYAGALRVGDVFLSTFPGEPFPQNHTALVPGVEGPAVHFTLGAAQDFLGYMAADEAGYLRTAEEGATNLAGCPEEDVLGAIGAPHDSACTGHWTLQVSPTIGRHSVCTIQDAADRLGFIATNRMTTCAALTASDIPVG